MNIDILKKQASLLPDEPGVYQFYDKENKLLYVGKAKNLKKRVSNYFIKKEKDSLKTKILINKINSILHIVVDTESDALLLENNLIKQYQPKYNVLLKDDKTFPWICIKNEKFPRVFSTRKIIKDNSNYFGPYASGYAMKALLELINKLYKLRTCNYVLSNENIEKKKYKICLEYHIGNCKGPCEGFQSESDYNESIINILQILKGNLKSVLEYLKDIMLNYAKNYNFEEAELVKNKIEILKKFQIKSTVVSSKINNVDVFSIVNSEDYAIVNYLKIIDGAIVQSHTIEIAKKIEEEIEDLLLFSIIELRNKFKSNSKEIIVQSKVNFNLNKIKLVFPVSGDKKKLLDLSYRNALLFNNEKQRRLQFLKNEKNENKYLKKLQMDLRLKELPVHIECFDNSNILGYSPVASCVVFINAVPKKSEYRHFNIKTVEGPNDFASMEEIIYRRYKRMISENKSLPQLIIIDGGKGQLNSALKSLKKLNLENKLGIIGIAKRLEEIYFPSDPYPLFIDKNSESLKIIQKIRNEAHRFGINFHRKKREEIMTESELDKIKGIGKSTIQKLFKSFSTIENIKSANNIELINVIGKQKAEFLVNYFKNIKL